MRNTRLVLLVAAGTMAAASAWAFTDTPWTLAQIESRYRGMSPVHIAKCDREGDGLFYRAERACVNSLYNALYRGQR